MKKYLSLFLAVIMLFLCSCKKEEPNKYKTADMLNITNEEKTFLGCKNRFDAVLSAMSAKITTLENAHNAVIRSENKEEYFLDENYILTSFEPFWLETISITEGFTPDMTNETAQEYYKLQGEGFDISFNSDNGNYELMFVSESLVKIHTAEYDQKTDSLRYSYTVESGDSETVEEFLEFVNIQKGKYVIQSKTQRCYIEFNSDDEIVYFCCGKLNTGEFTLNESIFNSPQEVYDGFWVLSDGKPSYSNIHTFENGILTHEDCSGGPWKTIKINAEDYASAFYGW